MLLDVIDFNRKRNGFSYDRDNEIAMYNKEVKEFFDAESTAERIDALVDCEYVRFGTQCKMAYNNVKELPYDKSVEQIMVSSLLEEIPTPIFDEILREAEQIVCEINAMKPLKKTTSKVKKGNIPNATETIEIMLNEKVALHREKQAKHKQAMAERELASEPDAPNHNAVG